MFLKVAGAIVLCLALIPAKPAAAQQVTYGKKPQLPAPFTTKSAGNGPSSAKPPEGFLPTAPDGFRVNIYAKEFKYPRFLAVAPNGDIFLADLGAGQVIVLRDPQHTGSAQQRENFCGQIESSLRDCLPRRLRLRRQHERGGSLPVRQADFQATRRS